ncbi:hypothetical protein HDA43_003905 [Streptosporangium sandarakinum]|uniref:Uncharacterized protein n=1 Tax=Streptosporangium sandarakinum TaxID=1260955 RepID=A0A852V3A5_9ACTN|nr:hypothetical protein [Streptosporangium sandarakinum]
MHQTHRQPQPTPRNRPTTNTHRRTTHHPPGTAHPPASVAKPAANADADADVETETETEKNTTREAEARRPERRPYKRRIARKTRPAPSHRRTGRDRTPPGAGNGRARRHPIPDGTRTGHRADRTRRRPRVAIRPAADPTGVGAGRTRPQAPGLTARRETIIGRGTSASRHEPVPAGRRRAARRQACHHGRDDHDRRDGEQAGPANLTAGMPIRAAAPREPRREPRRTLRSPHRRGRFSGTRHTIKADIRSYTAQKLNSVRYEIHRSAHVRDHCHWPPVPIGPTRSQQTWR